MKIPHWLVPMLFRNATRLCRRYSAWELIHGQSISFSQFGEDTFLEKCFFFEQAEGFYIDVGAFDPIDLSNTYLFYRKGWRGINIEPNPGGFRKFEAQRKRDINLNLAISDTEKQVDFTVDWVFSGIDDGTNQFAGRNPNAKRIVVQTRPLRSILEQYLPANTAIDFMTIDCEGHDRVVLESNDWKRFRPRVLMVEDQSKKLGTELDAYMQERGYDFFNQLHFTKVYTSRDFSKES